jgi:hypothetical protein
MYPCVCRNGQGGSGSPSTARSRHRQARLPPPFLKKGKLSILVGTGTGGRICSVSLPPLRGTFPDRYNLFLLVAKPGSVALVMLTWCRLVRVLRCAEHAHALQVVTHTLFKERDVARLSSWGSTLWWCVVPLWVVMRAVSQKPRVPAHQDRPCACNACAI